MGVIYLPVIKPADKKGELPELNDCPCIIQPAAVSTGRRQAEASNCCGAWVGSCGVWTPRWSPSLSHPPGKPWGCRWQQRLWDGKAQSRLGSCAQKMAQALQGSRKKKGERPTAGDEKTTLEGICPLDRKEVTGLAKHSAFACV